MHAYVRVTGAAILAAALLSACGTQIDGTASPAQKVIAPVTTGVTTSPSAEPTATPVAPGTSATPVRFDGVVEVPFGARYEWEDGLTVSVSQPTPFTPSRDAVFVASPGYDAFTFTITNNSKTTYDPENMVISGRSGTTEMTTVYDEINDYVDPPTRSVAPGDEVTFDLAFAVVNPDDILLDVMLDFTSYDAYFTSTGTTSKTPTTAPAVEAAVVTETQADHAGFGQTYEWAGGLRATVSAPTPFTPSEYAETEPAAAYLSVTVTIENATGSLYEPSYLVVHGRSGAATAGDVWDYDNSYSGAPWTGLFDGQSVTFKVGFAVTDPSDLTVQVSPGFDYITAGFGA